MMSVRTRLHLDHLGLDPVDVGDGAVALLLVEHHQLGEIVVVGHDLVDHRDQLALLAAG